MAEQLVAIGGSTPTKDCPVGNVATLNAAGETLIVYGVSATPLYHRREHWRRGV